MTTTLKICPFCKEEIREDAIKCRYCSSSLLPPQVESNANTSANKGNDNQTVYILDQDLVRFGKFAGAVLAIFVAVGIYLYGIDIKESTKEVESSAKEVEKSAEGISKIKNDVDKAQDQIKTDQGSMQDMVTKTQASLTALQKQVNDETAAEARAIANAEASAEATTRKIDAEEKSMADVQTRSAALLKEATDTVQQVQEKKTEFYAQLSIYVPGVTEPKDHNSGGASVPPGLSASQPASNAKPLEDRSFTPSELAKIYHFPADTDGTGQTVGLIELGGGYHPADLSAYFRNLGVPVPNIAAVSVDGGVNSPTTANSADGEVQMDIEVIGAAAPGARIVVYFAPNTNNGFLDAIEKAVNDTANHVTVLCISWGSPESSWTQAAMQQMNQALLSAAARKITVVVASGDNGPTDGVNDGKNHVDFPASSPWVTAVGGTHLHASESDVIAESVWDDQAGGASGGGVSVEFSLPSWQAKAGVPVAQQGNVGRGVPDVAADASPSTGYMVSVDGTSMIVGGTAAAAPLWAALVARINQGLGHNIGFMNPILYAKAGPGGDLHPITGPSGLKAGWNTTVGWGTPDGQKLLEAFR